MAELSTAAGSQVRLAYATKDAWAETGVLGTAYNLRATDFGVQLSKDTFESDEIRSDRQTSDMRHGMKSVSGDVSVELSSGAFDDLIASAMFNPWPSDNSIEVGTAQQSLRLHRGFTDIDVAHEFGGCVVNSWSFSVSPDSMVTSTFSFTGKSMTIYDTVSASELSSPTDKATNAPFDGFSGYIREANQGDSIGSADDLGIITSLDFSLENTLDSLNVVGYDTAQGLVEGRVAVSGTLNAYFDGNTLLNKFLNGTEAQIEFQVIDDLGNYLTFLIPRLKYSSGDVTVSGEGPIEVSFPFTALKDLTEGTTLRITRS